MLKLMARFKRLHQQLSSSTAAGGRGGGSDNNSDAATASALLQSREVFTLLINLMPSVQAERQLRFLCALEEFRQEKDRAAQKARGWKIKSVFMHSGAPYEVRDVPSHLAKLELHESCDLLHDLMVDELSALPEVAEILHKLSNSSSPSSSGDDVAAPRDTVGSLDGAHGEENDEDSANEKTQNTGAARQSFVRFGGGDNSNNSNNHHANNRQAAHGNLGVMAKAEQIVMSSKYRHDLINLLVTTRPELSYVLKVRFIAAMGQCLKSEADAPVEMDRMAKKLATIFFRGNGGGMFYIYLAGGDGDDGDRAEHDKLRAGAAQGNIRALERVRVNFLKELSLDAEVADWVRELHDQMAAKEDSPLAAAPSPAATPSNDA